jgi:hypothetical protein
MFRNFSGVAAIVFMGCILSACSHHEKACPAAAALADAASLTAFPRGTAPDPSHALYTVRITDVTTDCDIDKHGHSVDSSLEIAFKASRAPTGAPLDGVVPYFVVVTGDQGKILARQSFTAHFHFDPGQATTTFSDSVASTVIHLAKEKYAYDYQLLAGLQLTRAQLDYNRTVGPYTP